MPRHRVAVEHVRREPQPGGESGGCAVLVALLGDAQFHVELRDTKIHDERVDGESRQLEEGALDVLELEQHLEQRGVRRGPLGGEVVEPDISEPGVTLSDREREVLAGVAAGQTNREIAAELFLSPHTIKEHPSTRYRQLEVRNRAEAVQRAQRLGLL